MPVQVLVQALEQVLVQALLKEVLLMQSFCSLLLLKFKRTATW